jgi:hypothetical protein
VTAAAAEPTLEERLQKKIGKSMPLPDFLCLFGENVRDPRSTPRISQVLDGLKLTTAPFFATCPRSSFVTILRVDEQAEPNGGDASLTVAAPPWSARLADLVRDRDGFVAIHTATTLPAAALQLANQGNLPLPVLNGAASVCGVLTWRSLAATYAARSGHTLAKAMQGDDLPIVHVSNDVFAVLPLVREHGYVLVQDEQHRIKWLLTAADIIDRFEKIARPYSQLSEIEHMLHKQLGKTFTAEEIAKVQRYDKTGKIEDCVFNDYVKLIEPPAHWARLKWTGLDHVLFLDLLRQVKDVRNRVQHFHPISDLELLKLIQFKGMLKSIT